MSALTLIAFLFFLNILQNCLKDQTQDDTLSAVTLINPKLVQAREPSEENVLQDPNAKIITRKLLSIEDPSPDSNPRKRKFIHDFGVADGDWTNHLTQVTHQDLDQQKQKVENLREIWSRPKQNPKKQTLEDQVLDVKVKKFVNNRVLSDVRTIPKLADYWAAQRTTTESTLSYVEFEEPYKKGADFHEFQELNPKEHYIVRSAAEQLLVPPKPIIQETQPLFVQEVPEVYPLVPSAAPLVLNTKSPVGEVEAVSDPYDLDFINTPRYRRGSEEQSTSYPMAELFRPDESQITTTSTTTTTPRTFHVYTHPGQIHRGIWTTTASPTSTTTTTTTTTAATPTTKKFSIDNIYLTTSRPMPGRIFGSQRNPTNHRPYYKPATRIDYSPYRRVGYEPPLVRHEYYPMSVVGQYNGGEDVQPATGLLQLLWSLVVSFAKPIVSLVPNASKVGSDARCVELLTCEAHRLGKYMGPSARLLASTFSTVVRWMAPATERPAIDDAMTSASENTCRRQIESCDERSGGQSMLSMLAKMMEQQNTNREPKTLVT